jgi:hypothetical protein
VAVGFPAVVVIPAVGGDGRAPQLYNAPGPSEPVLACGRCAGSATPARGCGCGCFRLRERIRPSGPSMPPLASLPPPRSLLERHACEAVASTVVSRVPCSRLGAGFRAPAPINFFFLERLFRFFLHPPTPLKIKGGTWNMEQSRSPPTAGPGRQPPAEPPTYRRPSRQPEGGGVLPTAHATAQRPTANGQRPSGRGGPKEEPFPAASAA